MEPLRPGHTYRDQLSGLRLTVSSIGTRVLVTFEHDDVDDYSIPKSIAQVALATDVLEHDEQMCEKCSRLT